MNEDTISPSLQNLMRLVRVSFMAGVVVVFAPMAVTQTNHSSARNRHWSLNSALHAAPEAARAQKNPFEGDPREAAAGGKLFEQHCSDCHGPKAGGTRRGPSLLKREVEQAAPGTLFWTLTNGVVWHGMPAWSKLPEPERWQIVTFLETLKVHSTVPGPPAEPETH